MANLNINTIHQNGRYIHFIPTNKFKTIHFVLKMSSPLERDTVTKRALLTHVLREGTKNYPNREALENGLDELYGAGLTIDRSKRGQNHIITFRFEIANEKFIPSNEQIIQKAIDLFQEVIYKPNVEDQQFNSSIFSREKETLREHLKSIKDDKISYAQMRLIDTMCEGEDYALHASGYEEDLDDLTNEELYDYYLTALANDRFDLYVLGDFDQEDLAQKLSGFFQVTSDKKVHKNSSQLAEEPKQINEKVEYDDIQQSKLHLGYRTNCTYKDDNYPALLVFNGLFGGFPSSKLFLNVREKHSLAYYAASRIESYQGLLFVFSGIAPEDYKKTRSIIEEQFKEMQEGLFTEQEINETIDQLVNDYLETLDHPQGIVEMLYQQILGQRERTPQSLINDIKTVDKKDILQIARNIKEDTVFLLTNEGGVSGD